MNCHVQYIMSLTLLELAPNMWFNPISCILLIEEGAAQGGNIHSHYKNKRYHTNQDHSIVQRIPNSCSPVGAAPQYVY